MQTSQQTNGDYLNEISARATRLDGEVKAYTGKPAMAPVPALLDSARELSAGRNWAGRAAADRATACTAYRR